MMSCQEVQGEDVERVETIERVSFFRTLLVLASAIVLVVWFDQYTKALVVDTLRHGQVVPVVEGFFNITLTYNRGAAFGMLSGLPNDLRTYILTTITILALCVVFYFLIVDYYHDITAQFSLGLILGGAAGNIIDRVRMGQVVDFLDVYYTHYHWPAFNIADSAICIGVVLLLFRKTASASKKKNTD